MRRWLALLAIAVAVPFGLLLGFHARSVSGTLPAGEFWRLPWPAGGLHWVGGYGYGEGTHIGTEYWALDFNIPQSGYVSNAQEGIVTRAGDQTGCGEDLGPGTFIEITDSNGLVHHYAHLEYPRVWSMGQREPDIRSGRHEGAASEGEPRRFFHWSVHARTV